VTRNQHHLSRSLSPFASFSPLLSGRKHECYASRLSPLCGGLSSLRHSIGVCVFLAIIRRDLSARRMTRHFVKHEHGNVLVFSSLDRSVYEMVSGNASEILGDPCVRLSCILRLSLRLLVCFLLIFRFLSLFLTSCPVFFPCSIASIYVYMYPLVHPSVYQCIRPTVFLPTW
jgi:hypothetical protein